MNMYRSITARALIPLSLIFSAACADTDVIEPYEKDPQKIFWRLDVNHTAITLSTAAPDNQFQLVAVPRNIYGDPLPLEENVSFSKALVNDTTVGLTVDGLITGRSPTTSQSIYVRTTIGGITRADTVRVRVIRDDLVKRIKSLSLLADGDSSWIWPRAAIGPSPKSFTMKAVDMNDQVMTNTEWLRDIRSDNSDIVSVPNRVNADIIGEMPGKTWVYTNLYAFNKSFKDSVLVEVLDPPIKLVLIGAYTPQGGSKQFIFYPSELTIPVGGTVVWDNSRSVTWGGNESFYESEGGFNRFWTDTVDVVFDNPANILPGSSVGRQILISSILYYTHDARGEGGNIAPWSLNDCRLGESPCAGSGVTWFFDDGIRSRKFTQPGVYRYTSQRHPYMSGTITVK